MKKYIKSPLNYIGGKYKLVPQLLHLFPKNIDKFVDLFVGGGNVGINVNANKIYFNDNLIYLIDMYKSFSVNGYNNTLKHIISQIDKFQLSKTNINGFLNLRHEYNQKHNPLDLFVLIAYSFNYQIRFNNKHEFNSSFGRNKSSFNKTMMYNLENFITQLNKKNIDFTTNCFTSFNFSELSSNDFVYCDPPYLITTGSYNDGKRGFKGWSDVEEKLLLLKLDELNNANIRFGLSNVIKHKGK